MIEPLLKPVCSDPVEWVEGNLAFSPVTSPNRPGPISLAEQPWMREPLESFLDPSLQDLHLVMGTQTGKTTLCLLGTILLMQFDPAPLIWALPTDELAKRIFTTRLMPILRHNPCLRAWLPPEKEIKYTDLLLRPSPLYITGSRSPAKLASIPAAYIVIDEEAKIEHLSRNESHPVLLLTERTKSFARRLRVHASTPNTEANIFWQGFLRTDQRKFFVPCPRCGSYQVLEFNRETVRWDHPEGAEVTPESILRTARYYCQACHSALDDADLRDAMPRGEWRATAAGSPRCRGYWLNSLYSPNVTIGEMALEWHNCSADNASERYQNFINSWLAQPYTPYALKIKDEAVASLRSDAYTRGKLPVAEDEIAYTVVCYDPGEKQTHWVACVITVTGGIYVLDWGTILGFVTDPASGRSGAFDHFRALSWAKDDGGVHLPDIGYIDSGDWTMQVYDECSISGGVLMPTKGSPVQAGTWARSTPKSHPTLTLYTYSDYIAKRELYGERIARRTGGLVLPADADQELLDGLSGQMLEKRPDGRLRWKKVANDHFGDCIKLAQLSSHIFLDPRLRNPEPSPA